MWSGKGEDADESESAEIKGEEAVKEEEAADADADADADAEGGIWWRLWYRDEPSDMGESGRSKHIMVISDEQNRREKSGRKSNNDGI